MTNHVSSRTRRRAPSLLLLPCLLALGVLAAVAPLRDADSDSMTIRAQVLRAPDLRQAQTPLLAPAVLLSAGPTAPLEITGREDRSHRSVTREPRSELRPTYSSRAPPALL